LRNFVSDIKRTEAVSENRVLKGIFGSKRVEIMGSWVQSLIMRIPLPSIVRMMKSRRMRWTGLVARVGEDTSDTIINDSKCDSYFVSKTHEWCNQIVLENGL
jgi:hypothetical protein